jgi:3-oxoacyl-[acyl-carrier protein] reductase
MTNTDSVTSSPSTYYSSPKGVVLVTGGAGGIGSAICKKFAENGFAVIATYHTNKAKAEKLLEELNEITNGLNPNRNAEIVNPKLNHSIFNAPTTDASKLVELKTFVAEKYGKLNVLVNNAGITTPIQHDDLEGLTDEWIDKIMQTNVRGTFAMIRAMASLLGLGDGLGLIVNISSVAAVTGIGSNVAYCASKAAIDSITRSLARALAPNIRVVSVAPGWVLGEYTKAIDPDYLQTQIDKTPMARLASQQDVANAVFALTDTLTFCTGNIIEVDGGRKLL